MAYEPRNSNSFLVFACSMLALLVVAVLLLWRIAAGPKPQELDARRAAARITAREKIEKDVQEALTSDGWVDKAKGIVRVPVTTVFAATATELRAKKPAASQIKVEAPLPMPVIDPTSTEPPPAALPSAPQGADTIRFTPPEPKPSASLTPATPALAAHPSPLTK